MTKKKLIFVYKKTPTTAFTEEDRLKRSPPQHMTQQGVMFQGKSDRGGLSLVLALLLSHPARQYRVRMDSFLEATDSSPERRELENRGHLTAG